MMDETVTAPADRPRRITRSHVHVKPLTRAQEHYVKLARTRPGNVLGVEDVPSWLTLRAIVDKGHATALEREGGRPAGRILAVRVREA